VKVDLRAWARRARLSLAKRKFYASLRPSDVFFVTYPKSGTTWLSFMVANVIKRNPDEELNLRDQSRYIPDINLKYEQYQSLSQYDSNPDPRFFRLHAPYDPALPKVVYVLRDPRDVMVSFWHYKKMTNLNFTKTLKEFVLDGPEWPCSWDQHVADWLFEHKHTQLVLVKYEDLHKEAPRVLKMVLDFAGVPYEPADIQKAIEASRFEKMRMAEDKFGIHTPPANPNERFVRRGKVGTWRDEVDMETLNALEQRFSAVMRKVGYEPEFVQPTLPSPCPGKQVS
jgi:hypothetical protein